MSGFDKVCRTYCDLSKYIKKLHVSAIFKSGVFSSLMLC